MRISGVVTGMDMGWPGWGSWVFTRFLLYGFVSLFAAGLRFMPGGLAWDRGGAPCGGAPGAELVTGPRWWLWVSRE